MANIIDNLNQDLVCKYCEDFIICGSSSCSTFLCEGRYCERAREEYIEGYCVDINGNVIVVPIIELPKKFNLKQHEI
jgi:hypothetical protein